MILKEAVTREKKNNFEHFTKNVGNLPLKNVSATFNLPYLCEVVIKILIFFSFLQEQRRIARERMLFTFRISNVIKLFLFDC